MPLAFFVFLCCVTLFAQSHAAVSELTVGNYSLISSTRVGRTTWQYVYRATVTNSGTTDIPNVTATATSAVTGLTVVSGTITFGDVPPGKAVSSSTTFTVSVDRSYSLNQADLTWIITSTIATGSIGATGGALATSRRRHYIQHTRWGSSAKHQFYHSAKYKLPSGRRTNRCLRAISGWTHIQYPDFSQHQVRPGFHTRQHRSKSTQSSLRIQ